MKKQLKKMSVPVLSLMHLPSKTAIHQLKGPWVEVYYLGDRGWLVWYCDDLEGAPDWFAPIAEACEGGSGGSSWVRFDEDGSKVEGVPLFDWN